MPRVAALVLSALLVVAVPAAAARTRTGSFWATVNICDSPGEPDSMGVRAGMSGTGRLQRMYTRFRAQYWSADRWHPVRGSTSPWINLGLARVRSEQVGWTFAFSTPAAGTLFHTRGLAEFKWRGKRKTGVPGRARWVVARRRRAVTRGGLRRVDGGDPPGTSIASCLIR